MPKTNKKPFIPLDTRKRIISALETGGYTYKQVADTFGCGVATVNRIWRRHRETGNYDLPARGGGMRRAVSREEEEVFRGFVEENSLLTLDELTVGWAKLSRRKKPPSRSAIIRALKRIQFSRKKVTKRAKQKLTEENTAKRAQFLGTLRRVDVDRLVFLDEAGFQESLCRQYARSLVGTPAVSYQHYGYAKNITVCGAIRSSGPVAMVASRKAMTKKRFYSFLKRVLFPRLQPGDILVLDNLPAHKGKEILRLAKFWGIKLLFTPPYSPELNPIEMVWGWMKNRLRRRLNRTKECFRYALAGAWRAVGSLCLTDFIDHCAEEQLSPQAI